MGDIKVIAYYLPQFYQNEDNDRWWGEGFTEWTNVSRAVPLYRGHYQPRIPSDLGYYNLLDEDVRVKQAELAKEAGVSAFCYWHYWMGRGKRLLSKPLDQMINSGKPDFPFCLGWANHDWEKKTWDKNGPFFKKEVLIRQYYGDHEEIENHFNTMLTAFLDKRYFRINDRPVFVIFRPDSIPNFALFKSIWNRLAAKNGLPNFCFIACIMDKNDIQKYLENGYDYVNLSMLNYPFNINYSKLNIIYRILKAELLKKPNVVEYADAIKVFNDSANRIEQVIPTLIPNWDHSPRSGYHASILNNSSPILFKQHVTDILESVMHKRNRVVFLKSWNEWGEGNYIEPDKRYGMDYIRTLAECLSYYEE